jgi:2',3'-cyclic-nucleotide 2'-phosphodiesterase / 3'-nucleotidase
VFRKIPRAALALLVALSARGETVHLRVLATTDLHGNIFPYDYFMSQPAPRGLAKIATLIARERIANPNNLLVDCGDTLQGSPLETVHLAAIRAGKREPDPMMTAMNRLGYDAMTVGNHEFDLGLADLDRARRDAKFPWISANLRTLNGVQPYIVKTIAGVRVAVIGVTTESVPSWEPPENFRGVRFGSAVGAVRRGVDEIRHRHSADVILVAAHTGIDRDPETGAPRTQDLAGENVAYQIAQIPGVDGVIFGHTHTELGEYHVGSTLLLQPRNWGMSLGEMDLTLDRAPGGWKIQSKSSRVIPVSAATPADETLLSLARPYHDAAERYLDTAVAQSPEAMSAALARAEDTPLIDAIQAVELSEARAQVSFTAAFDIGVRISKGPVTVRQIAALYPYDNTLYAIETTGRVVREALEYSAKYYNSCSADCSLGPLINPDVYGYNYDIAEGVNYEIDLRRKAGERIVNLTWQGRPLADDQPLRVAINSYRAGGGGGYAMFGPAKVVWRSSEEIRDLIIRYYTARGALSPSATDNWRVIPAEAREEIKREAAEEARRPRLK